MQDDEIELHPALADRRLQGLNSTPLTFQRLLSLHASLIALRCQYSAMLHRWVAEMDAFNEGIHSRGVASTADAALSKSASTVPVCPPALVADDP